MHPIVNELESIVKRGATFTDNGNADVPGLQQWLHERQVIFSRLESAVAELLPEDHRAVAQLFQEVLGLDATLLPVLEQQLSQLGNEIISARKIHRLLGKSVYSHPSLIFQRSL
jgi:hypothetical protein